MKFTMAVDKTVATRFGHTIQFKKGEPIHVPKECWRAVQEAGAVPEDQETVNAVPEQKPVVPDDPVVRRSKIMAVFEQMVETNKREDFTGAGLPRTETVSSLAGFDVDNKERDEMWVEFTQAGGAQ